jgi:hypothetical protein
VFVQAGVGAMSGAVAGYLVNKFRQRILSIIKKSCGTANTLLCYKWKNFDLREHRPEKK